MSTVEDDKLIAEFMGLKSEWDMVWINDNSLTRGRDYIEWASYEEIDGKEYVIVNPEYHLSWDWLMPVAKKIKLLDVDLSNWRMITNPSDYEVDKVFNQVVEFIKWYNENKGS